jgi:hypothetical protein
MAEFYQELIPSLSFKAQTAKISKQKIFELKITTIQLSIFSKNLIKLKWEP